MTLSDLRGLLTEAPRHLLSGADRFIGILGGARPRRCDPLQPGVDWSDLRLFLAVSRHGTLAEAARTLHLDPSDMRRRLDGLETKLGGRLVERTPSGFVLTPIGDKVRAAAERIEAEAIELERRVTPHDVPLEGLVRLTVSEIFASRLISLLVVEFHRQHPGIDLQVITGSRLPGLSSREPELAIRTSPPQGQELLATRVATLRFALYASPDYLLRHCEPDLRAGLAGHEMIACPEEAEAEEVRWSRDMAHQARFFLHTNTLQAHLGTILAGGGIGVLPCHVGDAEPGLRRLTAPMAGPERGIWTAVHREQHTLPRVRAALQFFTREIKRRQGDLNGTS